MNIYKQLLQFNNKMTCSPIFKMRKGRSHQVLCISRLQVTVHLYCCMEAKVTLFMWPFSQEAPQDESCSLVAPVAQPPATVEPSAVDLPLLHLLAKSDVMWLLQLVKLCALLSSTHRVIPSLRTIVEEVMLNPQSLTTLGVSGNGASTAAAVWWPLLLRDKIVFGVCLEPG